MHCTGYQMWGPFILQDNIISNVVLYTLTYIYVHMLQIRTIGQLIHSNISLCHGMKYGQTKWKKEHFKMQANVNQLWAW